MTETYASQKRRLLRQQEQLPENLRGRVALYNVQAVLDLPPTAQDTLARALELGLKQPQQAIQCLQEKPDIEAQELIRQVKGLRKKPSPARQRSAMPIQEVPAAATPDSRDVDKLVKLFLFISPGGTRTGAECVVLDQPPLLLNFVQAAREFLEADPSPTETIFAVFWVLLPDIRERANQMLEQQPRYKKALQHLNLLSPENQSK